MGISIAMNQLLTRPTETSPSSTMPYRLSRGEKTQMRNIQNLYIDYFGRWKAPVGMSLFAPGTDFKPTIDSIRYLRDCTGEDGELLKKFMTFHIFFHADHIPLTVPSAESLLQKAFECPESPPYKSFEHEKMFKTLKHLTYPINVGRNVARDAAITHFVFPSDIELYPSLNVVPKFLEMIARNEAPLLNKKPR